MHGRGISSGEAKRKSYRIFEPACRHMEEQSSAFPLLKYAQRHDDVWGAEVQLYALLTSTVDEVGCQLHGPTDLPRGNNPRYSFDMTLGRPHCQSGGCGERISSSHALNRNPITW
jgi:hypothetical protein